MALTRITGTVIEDNAITSDKISNLSVTTAMIASGAITADKLAANSNEPKLTLLARFYNFFEQWTEQSYEAWKRSQVDSL